jgi:hypothetical protein
MASMASDSGILFGTRNGVPAVLGVPWIYSFHPSEKTNIGGSCYVGWAFIPNFPNVTNPDTGSVTVDVPKAAKINVKGAPRYAVLAIGILIVLSALWDGISDHASQTSYDFFGDQVTAK